MMSFVIFSFLSSDLLFVWLGFLLGAVLLTGSVGSNTISYFFCGDMVGSFLSLLVVCIFFSILLACLFEKFSWNAWSYFFLPFSFLAFFLLILFFSDNLMVFYIVFELTILPTFMLIMGWGYSFNRSQASYYMLFYTLLASLPMLVTIIMFYSSFMMTNFFLVKYYFEGLSFSSYFWLPLLMVFMVKLPLFLVHLWLPKAHVDAPLLGSMILAGVLLKLGGFGLYKVMNFSYMMFSFYCSVLVTFALVGAFIITLVCLRQTDMKSLIAYSSVVHMGPVFVSFFLQSFYSLVGSIWLMISHGFCSCGLFYIMNFFYSETSSRSLMVIRGMVLFTPLASFAWGIFCMNNMGCPPSFNFFSELVTMFSCFFYSSFVMSYFFLILLGVGFYCVILLTSLFHGFSSFSFYLFMGLKVSDLILILYYVFILNFFVLFMGLVV